MSVIAAASEHRARGAPRVAVAAAAVAPRYLKLAARRHQGIPVRIRILWLAVQQSPLKAALEHVAGAALKPRRLVVLAQAKRTLHLQRER